MNYYVLTDVNLFDYIKNNSILQDVLGDGELKVKEIGDGNVNYVFKVENITTKKAIIIKQAVPYLRCDGESAKLDKNRLSQEYYSLKHYGEIMSNNIPKLYQYDEIMCVLVMEYINGGVLKANLIQNKFPYNLAQQVASFLANVYFKTSLFGLTNQEWQRLQQNFIPNYELIELTEKYVFSAPYL